MKVTIILSILALGFLFKNVFNIYKGEACQTLLGLDQELPGKTVSLKKLKDKTKHLSRSDQVSVMEIFTKDKTIID